MPTVHVRITDSSTGQPLPVRARFSAGGRTWVPFGRLETFSTLAGVAVGGNVLVDGLPWAYLDGSCEVNLPPGPVTVAVSRGPEYLPLDSQVVLGAGQLALRLVLERRPESRPEGWLSADSRCHALTPHAALLEAAAEDLDFVNLLALETPSSAEQFPALPNLLAFSGSRPALERPGHAVVVNTLNAHPVLGTLSLLDCHRLVHPLRFGGPDRADDWSLVDWCDQCHRKRGLVVWPDLPRLTATVPQGEALAACLLGKVDAFEVCRLDGALTDYYRLLACDCRLPLVGGSGKDSNASVLGAVRTYAHLTPDSPGDYGGWVGAVRAGRTFVTTGPLLLLSVGGAEPGATVIVDGAAPLAVRVEVRGASGGLLEVVRDGQVVAAGPAPLLEAEVPVAHSGWLAARYREDSSLPSGPVGAHTSPVLLRVEGKTPPLDLREVTALQTVLGQTRTWIERDARCEEKHRQRLLGVLRAAEDRLHPP
jgi:hypothetical protein